MPPLITKEAATSNPVLKIKRKVHDGDRAGSQPKRKRMKKQNDAKDLKLDRRARLSQFEHDPQLIVDYLARQNVRFEETATSVELEQKIIPGRLF